MQSYYYYYDIVWINVENDFGIVRYPHIATYSDTYIQTYTHAHTLQNALQM